MRAWTRLLLGTRTLVLRARIALAVFFLAACASSAAAQDPLDLPLTNWQAAVGIFTPVQLAATGGTPPYTYSYTPSAQRVPGMHVRNRPYPLPANFPGTATGGFIGVVNQVGVFQSSIRVTDSTGAFFDRTFTATVTQQQELSNTNPPKPLVGTPYDFALKPFGLTGPAVWSVAPSSTMPPGLSVNASGHIVGTPTTPGTYTPTLFLEDDANGFIRNVNLTWVVNPWEITTNGEMPNAIQGTPYSQTIQAPGCAGCVFSTTSLLPAGLSFASNGTLSGTPTGTSSGTTLNITATSGAVSVTKTFSLKILGSSLQPLAVNTGPLLIATVGSQVNFALLAGGGTPPYSWSIESGTLPDGLSIEGPGETLGSGLLPGFQYLTGRLMEAGLFTFTLKVTDSQGVTSSRAITVNASKLGFGYFNITPATAGTPYTFRLLGLGGANSGNYTWTAPNGMPGGLALDPATGTISGTPIDTGFFQISTQIEDTAGNVMTGPTNLSIAGPTATSLNIQPLASVITLAQGSSFSQNLTVGGGTGPYTITAVGSLPPGFVLASGDSSTNVNGALMFTGTALQAGTFPFTLRAEDSLGNVGVRTFRLVVTSIAVLTTTLQAGAPGVAYSQRLLSGGGSGPVTWSLDTGFTLPPGLALSAGGLINGTPSEPSSYNITFAVTDSQGNRATRSLTLTISALSISGSDFLPKATSGVPYNYQFTATGAGGSPTWTASGLPAGLTLAPNGALSGTTFVAFPAAGNNSVLVTVIDGGRVVTRRFTLVVGQPVPTFPSGPPLVFLADLVVGQATTVTVSPNLGTPPYTVTLAPGSTLPPGLQLVSGARLIPTAAPGTTVLAGAPTTAGLYTFDLMGTDAAGRTVVRTHILRVSNITVLSGIRTPRAGEAYSFQFTTVGGTGPYTYEAAPWLTPFTLGLPPGLTLSSGGLLSGTPTSTGIYTFTVTAHDSTGAQFSRNIGVNVADFINGGTQGLLISTSNPADVSLGVWTEWSVQLNRANSAAANATWSLTGGSLPPGLSLNGGTLTGRPSTAGTYVFTLRGNDASSPAQFAQREFTMRVVPMQLVAPAVGLNLAGRPAIPPAQVGVPYSYRYRVAGGTPPYTFANAPSFPTGFTGVGLTLSPAGVLSGTPTQSGTLFPGFVVTDAAGYELVVGNLLFTIAPAGLVDPLRVDEDFEAESPVSMGVDFGGTIFGRLDTYVRSGVAPYHWSLAPGSSLPPGMEIVPGRAGVSDIIAGKPTVAGTYSFTLNVEDSAGQTGSVTMSNVRVIDLTLAPVRVPTGVVGTPYTATLTLSGGTPPYGSMQLVEGSSMPPGLALSPSGVLSGTPAAPGNFIFGVQVNDTVRTETFVYRLTIDNAAGEAKAVSLSPSIIEVSQAQGAPGTAIPVTINITNGHPEFTAVVSGIPGATLSVTSGTTPATITLNLNTASLAQGTYHGFVGVSVPSAANLYEVAPITMTVGPPPTVAAISVTPNSGSGITQTFTFAFSDSAGVTADLNAAQVRFVNVANSALSCVLHYRASNNTIRMQNDSGVWGPFVPFGAGTLANSRCSVDLGSSTATPSGNDLSLALNMTFLGPMSGPANVSLRANSAAGPTTGWVQRGTYTVGAVLEAASITPDGGTGMSQTFTANFSDSLGVTTDLRSAQVRVGSGNVGSCVIQYNGMTNKVRILDDAGAPMPWVDFGGSTQANSQCTLVLSDSGAVISGGGNDLALTLSLSFDPNFLGAKTVSLRANSNFGTTTGFVPRGTWTVGAVVNPVAVLPSSGSSAVGAVQGFNFTYTDTAGVSTDLRGAKVRFSGANGSRCLVDYNATTQMVRMQNDSAVWSAFVPLGTAITGWSTMCDVQTSSASENGNNLSLTLSLVFKAPFAGDKTISMRADSTIMGQGSWGPPRGTWTVFTP